MGDKVIVNKELDNEANLDLGNLELRANTGAEPLDYQPNSCSFSELNTLNSPKVKTKREIKTNTKSKRKVKSGNMLSDLVSPPEETPNIIDRFVDYLDELIRRLVNGFVDYLERNHERNFDFIMNLLFGKKRAVRKKDGSFEDDNINQS